MKLVHQLPLALGVALLVASAAGLFGVFQMNEAADTYERLVEVDGAQARQVADALVAFKNQVQNAKDVVMRGKNPKQLEKYWGAFEKYEQACQAATEKLAVELPLGDARSMIERFNVLHEQMGQSYRKAIEQFKASGFDIAAGDLAMDGIDREPAILLRESGSKLVEQTTAAIADGLHRDLLASLGDDVGAGAYSLRFQYRPLIRFVWLGAFIMALGGVTVVVGRRQRGAGWAEATQRSTVATDAGSA